MSIFASAAGLRPRMLLLGILLILIGGATLAVKSGDSFRFDDELRYHDLAHSLLHNHAYATQGGAPTAWWPPGYPFAISGVYAVWDRPLAAKFLNVACLALAVFGAALLAGRQHRNGLLVTPYMALCYPIFFYTASCLYPQTLGSLLLVIVIGIVSNPPFSRAGAVLAGLTYGLLCLTIPAFLLLLPLVLVFIMLAGRNALKAALTKSCIVAAMAAITVAPWTIRNYVQFHAFVPVSTNSGFNLLLGNSPLTQPDSKPDMTALCPAADNPSGEIAFDRALTRCATAWMVGNPAQAVRLYLGKVLNYFNYRNQLSTQTGLAEWTNWIMFATYYPLLLLALLRLAYLRRYALTQAEALAYLLYFGNAFASALFFTRLRFRIPFDLLLIVIDGAFIAWLFDAYMRRRSSPSAVPA